MKLINKNSFAVIEIEDNTITAYNFNEFYILQLSTILNLDNSESVSYIPNKKYIKGLNIVGYRDSFTVVSIIEMTNEEKLIVEETELKEAEKQKHIDSFKGFKYKLKAHGSILDEMNTFHKLYQIGLAEGNDRDLVYNENGEVDYIFSYWNNITPQILIILTDETIFIDNDQSKGRMFQLEVNPNEKVTT